MTRENNLSCVICRSIYNPKPVSSTPLNGWSSTYAIAIVASLSSIAIIVRYICHRWFDVASVCMYVKYVCIYLCIRTLYTCEYACMCVCVQGNVMLCNALRIGRNNMCQLEKTSLFEGLGFTFLATKKITLQKQNVCKII